MRSSIGIEVAAPADLVFGLARDVERWPAILPHYLAARRVGARDADGRQLAPILGLGLPVTWRSLTWSEPATHRLRFVHRGGATNGMDVTWRIEPVGADGRASRVEIEHDFRPRVSVWAWFIDHAFTRPIAGRTLASFRAIAEALADESGAAAEANLRT